jgi:hypothetical protein
VPKESGPARDRWRQQQRGVTSGSVRMSWQHHPRFWFFWPLRPEDRDTTTLFALDYQ